MSETSDQETRDLNRDDLLEEELPALPKTLKHYKVIREIGAGGMGRVLKCLDTTLNRYVAIKMLRPSLARDEGFIERFRREALAVAKTRHPNIVHLYSIDREGPHVFYSMEYVEGEGLEKMLERRGRIPEREAVDIMRQAAEGLSHVHRAGILHRDIKPSNTLLDSSNRVLLTDFGLAKMDYHQILRTSPSAPGAEGAAPRSSADTDPGRIMGTPYYMAPECISGRTPDMRADIYALGVVFYEMLTNRVPFDGETAADVFQAHLNDIPIPIGELSPEASLPVANIVYKCIEKNPSARYQTCTELLEELNKVAADWHLAKEIEEKKRLSLEIAQAMTLETRPASHRFRGRLLGLFMLLLAAVGFLFVVGEFFKDLQGTLLPAGSHEDDANWRTGRAARMRGILEGLSSDGEEVRLSVRRTEEEGHPLGTAVLTKTAWEDKEGPAAPLLGDFIFVEGLVETVGGVLQLRVPSRQVIWFPMASRYFTSKNNRDVPIDWEGLRGLSQESRIKVTGTVLVRGAMGLLLSLGDGKGEFVHVELLPNSPARKLRHGDFATVRGRLGFDTAGGPDFRVPIVKKAILLKAPKFAQEVPSSK